MKNPVVPSLTTWWRLFCGCAAFCNRMNAYADRLVAIAAYMTRLR